MIQVETNVDKIIRVRFVEWWAGTRSLACECMSERKYTTELGEVQLF